MTWAVTSEVPTSGRPWFRVAGLADRLEELSIRAFDGGDVPVPLRERLGRQTPENRDLYVSTIGQICDELFARVQASLRAGRFPLTLGGDHSVRLDRSRARRTTAISRAGSWALWVDAHADMNTPATSRCRGTFTACRCPRCWAWGLNGWYTSVASVRGCGLKMWRWLGFATWTATERTFVRETGIRYYTMKDIDQRGMYAVLTDALDDLTRRCAALHVSFDLDAVDPVYAPGVSTPVRGGLTLSRGASLLEVVAERGLFAIDGSGRAKIRSTMSGIRRRGCASSWRCRHATKRLWQKQKAGRAGLFAVGRFQRIGLSR